MAEKGIFTKKERREFRREEQRKEAEGAKRLRTTKKAGWWLVTVAVVVATGAGIWVWAKSQVPESPDLSRAFPELSRNHIQVGQTFRGYNSNPPTSGSHWSNPLARGIYAEEQPDEALVHNLEHGEIWIAYHPRVGEEAMESLKKIANSYNKVIMTPRSKNDTDIALSAWTRLDAFNLEDSPLDKKRIEDFIKRYRNKGPELVP